MKIKAIFLSISLVMLTLSCENELTAEMIVNKSLEEAHGGKANWELPKMVLYEKTTILYDSLGNIESQKKQRFHNTLQPQFTSKVIWTENGEEKRIVFDGKDTFVFIDGFQVTDDKKVAVAHKEIMGAQYVLWQPYKLLADEVSLELEGRVRLEDGSKAYKIKATYTDSDTEWWYYFDTKTFLLKENLVKHGATYSQIINIKHEEKTGLRLHKERKSFMIDIQKDQKYLRAHYYYNILELK
ncbi:hypothetical protein H2O64_05685 [Kordia sp. YSTF-M3]|uniref:Lipoprotein n=1 Tax=Kordia aestuariivivens TaxID=2759037 RepID=A0ABR7Q6N8_9FLAO|nr:hypothetical protein [Kordia aestuariivivens]MBC8754153.1 hypothetical protein [Kordia aestuariivivens]